MSTNPVQRSEGKLSISEDEDFAMNSRVKKRRSSIVFSKLADWGKSKDSMKDAEVQKAFQK
jgi:hypothetical protein